MPDKKHHYIEVILSNRMQPMTNQQTTNRLVLHGVNSQVLMEKEEEYGDGVNFSGVGQGKRMNYERRSLRRKRTGAENFHQNDESGSNGEWASQIGLINSSAFLGHKKKN
jgi:hypothetical protein